MNLQSPIMAYIYIYCIIDKMNLPYSPPLCKSKLGARKTMTLTQLPLLALHDVATGRSHLIM